MGFSLILLKNSLFYLKCVEEATNIKLTAKLLLLQLTVIHDCHAELPFSPNAVSTYNYDSTLQPDPKKEHFCTTTAKLCDRGSRGHVKWHFLLSSYHHL